MRTARFSRMRTSTWTTTTAEVVIMKRRSKEIRSLADGVLSLRGVKHGKLVVTSTGKD
jgi:metal-responsive CopG/Arc/MetJ family transcriptional regulator